MIVLKYNYDNSIIRYLFVIEKEIINNIKEKVFSGHGDIINRNGAGGGYHGNCSNCGMPLVTDLGYCSWDDTVCKIESSTEVIIDIKFGWTKFKNRATVLTKEKALKFRMQQQSYQGWGEFNFSELNINY